MTYFKLPARISRYVKLRLRKQSRTRRLISIEIEVVTRQCLKHCKSFEDMIAEIAAEIFSNRYIVMETTLLLSNRRRQASLLTEFFENDQSNMYDRIIA